MHDLIPKVLILSAFTSFIFVILAVGREAIIASDFVNYFVGASLVAEKKGDLIYDLPATFSKQKEVLGEETPKNITVYRALPFVSLFLTPFTFLDIFTAYKLFALLNLLLLVVVAAIFKRGLLLSFLFWPVLQTLALGQLSIILVLIVALVYLNLKKGRDFYSGFLSSLLLIKLPFLLFFPFLFLLAKARIKFTKGLIAGGLFILVSSVISLGFGWIKNYPHFLSATESPDFGSRPERMWTFVGLFRQLKFLENSDSVLLAVNIILYFLVLYLFWKRYKKLKFDRGFVAASMLFIFFSIHFLTHDLSFLLVSIFVLFNLKKYAWGIFLYLLIFLGDGLSPGIASSGIFLSGVYFLKAAR